MLTIKASNPAFQRALINARSKMPEVTELEATWLYQVKGSKGDLYKVEFSFINGDLAATCTCPAHTGIDPEGLRPTRRDYIPKDCYHIARCYDYRRVQAEAQAEARRQAVVKGDAPNYQTIEHKCFYCGGTKASDEKGPLVIALGYMQHAKCDPDYNPASICNERPHVPLDVNGLCGECETAEATRTDGLCDSCRDLLFYCDMPGASAYTRY